MIYLNCEIRLSTFVSVLRRGSVFDGGTCVENQ